MEIMKREDVFGRVLAGGVNGATTMDSREIAELTEKQHAHVCRDIRTQLEAQGINQSTFGSVYKDQKGEARNCYKLDYEQTMILVSGYSILLRAKIVKRWQELENQVRNSKPLPSYQIVDEVERAKAWIIEKEETLKLQHQIEEQQPKVEFYDTVADSTNTIEMGEVSKVLNNPDYGRNKLFEFLRNNNILMKNNQPYQRYVDAGYFRVLETTFTKPNGDAEINLKTVVYQKGVDYIRKLISKE